MIVFNYFGHLVINALVSYYIATTPNDVFFILLGGLLPDIDHKKSTLGRFNPFARFMKHRGWTHTLLGCAILSLPALLINEHSFFMLLIGCISHIIGDKLHSILFSKKKFKIKVW